MNIIRYASLENGLKIVVEEIPHVRSVSVGIWINVGSRMEEESNQGLAHFIEHMLFKGTKNRSAKKISNDIDYFGGNINAFTTHDHTCFHVKMPYNHIENGLDVLGDIILNSRFSTEDIEKEKVVIFEEIKMYEDSPEDYVYEELLKKTYDNKGVGRNVLGSIESVSNIDREKILDFYSKYYLANNSVIVVSGRVDFDDIVELIEGNFSKWKSHKVDIKRAGQRFRPVKFIEDREDEQANLAIIFESPDDKNFKDFYSVKLLGNIVGNSPSSRLFQNIREKRGLTYSIYSSDNFYVDFAEFGIFASTSNENILEVYKLILEEIEDLKNNLITEAEFEFSKEQYKGSLFMSVEDTEDRMLLIGEYEISGQKYKHIDEVLAIVDKLDINYMKNVIDRIFNSPMSVGITGRGVDKYKKFI